MQIWKLSWREADSGLREPDRYYRNMEWYGSRAVAERKAKKLRSIEDVYFNVEVKKIIIPNTKASIIDFLNRQEFREEILNYRWMV